MCTTTTTYHETEAIDVVGKVQRKGRNEKASRVECIVPQTQKEQFGHVGVSFGKLKVRAAKVEIHQVLCLGPRSQKVALKVSGGISQLDTVRCGHFGKENGVNRLQQPRVRQRP